VEARGHRRICSIVSYDLALIMILKGFRRRINMDYEGKKQVDANVLGFTVCDDNQVNAVLHWRLFAPH
jgi:hypothetical protein